MSMSNWVVLKRDASRKHTCRPRRVGRKERGYKMKGRGKIDKEKDEGMRRSSQ